MMMKQRILFLCTGNSARSQMAEAWTRALRSDSLEPYSAGIEAHGINPLTVEVMTEAAVNMDGQSSKTVSDFSKKNIPVDYVVTLCDDAASSCPVFPAGVKVLHRGFRDPAAVQGSRDEKLKAFRDVRDEIRKFVESLPESLDFSD